MARQREIYEEERPDAEQFSPEEEFKIAHAGEEIFIRLQELN